MSDSQFLSVKDIRRITGWNPSVIYELLRNGVLPGVKDYPRWDENTREYVLVGSAGWRVKKSDFKKFLENNSNQNDPVIRRRNALVKLHAVARQIPYEFEEFYEIWKKNLKERERYVLERRYGVDGKPGATLKELSDELGLSRERIRQIQRGAEKKLIFEVRYGPRYPHPKGLVINDITS